MKQAGVERRQNTILDSDMVYAHTYVCTMEDRGAKRERNARYVPGIASIFGRSQPLL